MGKDMSRYITKKDNQWPASTGILLTLEKCKVESTRTCYHTPTSMAKMRSTDSSRYACGCVEEVDALRQRPDLLSMTWLCPRCSESWQPPSPTLPQLPQLHLAKVTVTAGWRAQRTSPPGPTWDELRGHSHSLGPRLLWALHCSSASLSLPACSYFPLLPWFWGHSCTRSPASEPASREPILGRVQWEFPLTACYAVHWDNRLRKLCALT